MSRAVITTDAPGCRELVKENENGFLVPPADSGSLARAMEFFIKNPQKCHEFGLASRAFCISRFEVGQVADAVVDHLSSQPVHESER